MNEKSTYINGVIISILLIALMWGIKIYEYYTGIGLYTWGLKPRSLSHIYGIITMPFLHGDWNHLWSNTPAFMVLSTLTYWTYKKIYFQVSLIILILGGFWTWIIGSDNIHIGASCMIYGYAAFLFFAGIFSKNFRLMALSALIVFLYGSLIWGVFPLQPKVSWEGHLSGGAAGLFAAYAYRAKFPTRKKYDWEDEIDEDEISNEDSSSIDSNSVDKSLNINYHYISNKKSE